MRLLQTRTQESCRTYFFKPLESTGVEVTTSNTEVKDIQTIKSDFALGFDRGFRGITARCSLVFNIVNLEETEGISTKEGCVKCSSTLLVP